MNKIGKTMAFGITLIILFGIIIFSFIGNSEENSQKDNIVNNEIKEDNKQSNIIEIINAEHLDKDRNFIGDIIEEEKDFVMVGGGPMQFGL